MSKKPFLICRCDPATNGGRTYSTFMDLDSIMDTLKPVPADKAPDWLPRKRTVYTNGTSLYYIG